MIKPEEMSTSRLRSYAKKNEETVEKWRLTVIRLHLIRLLTEAHGNEETPHKEFASDAITKTRGQNKIFYDLMNEYDLCYKSSIRVDGYSRETIQVDYLPFSDMIEEIGEEEPVFNSEGVEKTSECDIYYLLSNVSLTHLIYIYNHQDEFCFMNKAPKKTNYSSAKCEGLGVFHKALAEEADNLSFRNALDDFYNKRIGDVSKMVFGNTAPELNPLKPEYGKDDSIYSYPFVGIHNDCLPSNKNKITEDHLEKLIDQTTQRIQIFQDTLEQLQELRASLVEAGGDAAWEDLYYQKMIDEYYLSLPLFINSPNKAQQALAKRAAVKKFH